MYHFIAVFVHLLDLARNRCSFLDCEKRLPKSGRTSDWLDNGGTLWIGRHLNVRNRWSGYRPFLKIEVIKLFAILQMLTHTRLTNYNLSFARWFLFALWPTCKRVTCSHKDSCKLLFLNLNTFVMSMEF